MLPKLFCIGQGRNFQSLEGIPTIPDRVGEQLGNYRLICLIGHGGFADVYLGEHIYLKTQAAIKVLQLHLGDDEQNDFLEEETNIAEQYHSGIKLRLNTL